MIHDYADQDYSPEKSINLYYKNPYTHHPGELHMLDGKSLKGLLLYNSYSNSYSFKETEKSKKEKIYLEDIKAVTMYTHSYIVANGFPTYGKLGLILPSIEQATLLLHVATTDKFAFYKYQPETGEANYLVRRHNEEKLVSLPVTHKAFVEKARELFHEYPQLVKLLEEKKMTANQVVSLLRFIQYTDAEQAKKPIWYTATFELTDKPDNHAYHSLVNLNDNKWKLDFYNKAGDKIFTESYPYEQPDKSDGKTAWYYNGTDVVRKKAISFSGNTTQTTALIFHRNSKQHYNILTDKHEGVKYLQVLSEDGTQILDHLGNGREEFYDEVAKRTVTREFKKWRLASSYYTDEKKSHDLSVHQEKHHHSVIQKL